MAKKKRDRDSKLRNAKSMGKAMRMMNTANDKFGLNAVGQSPYAIARLVIEHLGLGSQVPAFADKKDMLDWAVIYLEGINPGDIMSDYRARLVRAKVYKQKRANGDFPKKDDFYQSWEWTTLRMKVLKQYGRKCMCCGATPETGAVIHVDHIKPLARYWDLRLDFNNLQVLCGQCNKGKGAWDETDYRPVY